MTNNGITSSIYTGFVITVDNEVAGTLAFITEKQPGIIAALNSNFEIRPCLPEEFPPVGFVWNGENYVSPAE